MKWPKEKEAAMKGTFLKTSTTHKAKTNKLKDCNRDFVPQICFSLSLVGVFFFCWEIIKNEAEI